MSQWLQLCLFCLPRRLQGETTICPRCWQKIQNSAVRLDNVVKALDALRVDPDGARKAARVAIQIHRGALEDLSEATRKEEK